MKKISLLILLVLTMFSFKARSQRMASGRVVDKVAKQHLPKVLIQNIDTRKASLADSNGRFIITGRTNDRITFRSIGYREDTLRIQEIPALVELIQISEKLEPVTISATYISFEMPYNPFRGQTVANKFDYDTDEIGGVVFRCWYWKKDEKKRNKRLEIDAKYRRAEKIDSVFNEKTIISYVPLQGAELKRFLSRYRPTPEEFNASNFNMLIYVNESYKKFKVEGY